MAHVHQCTGCQSAWVNSHPSESRAKASEAFKLYNDALGLLKHFQQQKYQAHAIVCLTAANADGDDILLNSGKRIPLLRQQHNMADSPCLCLNDFIRPLSHGQPDKIGIFASAADAAIEMSFADDEFRHLISQTLADRLAEACIEKAHQHVRSVLWGYAPDENLSPQELFSEKYQGIRPAVGYPSLPDQSLNFVLDELIDFGQIGIKLTENGAMRPHASVSGLMFSHPAAHYFRVGNIGNDQLVDYAKRRGMTPEEVSRFI